MAVVKIVGDTLVISAFAKAAATVNERLEESGRPVAEKIANTQRSTAPFTSRSGDTIASISAEKSDRSDAIFEIGPETFYSRFLEYGTVKMPPHPFVGPSGDLHADDWVQAAQDVAADI